jgi:hypothetical protein
LSARPHALFKRRCEQPPIRRQLLPREQRGVAIHRVIWCNDCNADDPSVHSGAPEICGNQIDDNCNGVVDEGCPATTTGP